MQYASRDQSTPFWEPNEDLARSILANLLGRGDWSRVTETGDMVATTFGRSFLWFDEPQRCGDIVRQEVLVFDDMPCAVHFKLLRRCDESEVHGILKAHPQLSKVYTARAGTGYWYEAHGE